MSEEAPKTPKAKKPKAPAAAEGAAAPEVVAAAAAPAEAAAPERKEITAKELLGEELGEVKVRRAKGSKNITCLLYTSPSPRDLSTSRMPSSA